MDQLGLEGSVGRCGPGSRWNRAVPGSRALQGALQGEALGSVESGGLPPCQLRTFLKKPTVINLYHHFIK